MAELLCDNTEWECRQSTLDSSELKSERVRGEGPNLLSGKFFGIYASVICDKSRGKAKQLLTNQTLILDEAHQCRDKGWQTWIMTVCFTNDVELRMRKSIR